uniref:uncharacterized protein LOC100179777 n=1 Tax=Ciona intestinalis TaxID=7719 RepID=UPI00089DB34C
MTDSVYYILFLVCFCCSHYTQAIWRMKNIALPPHHYASFDTKYRSPNEIEWEWVDHDNVPAPITASQACEVEKGTNISVALHCHDKGKYTVTSSCSECDVEIDRKKVVKVVDSPRCFFWKVSVQKQNENFVLQISVSKLQASYHDDPHSAFIPQLFRSRGERPVLTTIVGHDVRIAASNFNASGRFWEVTIHESEILKSEYLYIDSYFHLGMLGCVIMPTVVFANQDENVAIQDESGPLLEPATEIQYKTFTCKCRPHVTVLATKNQLLLTLNNFVTSRKMRIGGNVAAKHGVIVSDIGVTARTLYILLDGHLYGGSIMDNVLELKEILIPGLIDSLIGLATSPNCLINDRQSQYLTLESDIIITWSKTKIYFLDRFLTNRWENLKMEDKHSGSEIEKLSLSVVPGNLALTLVDEQHKYLIICKFKYGPQVNKTMHCKDFGFLQHVLSTDGLNFAFISTVYHSLVLWDKTNIYYFYNEGRDKGNFTEINSIKSVIFNHDHSQWLIQTDDNVLYYGSGRSHKHTRLARVDARSELNVTYVFDRVDGQCLRITWDSDATKKEKYQLSQELYSSVHVTEPNQAAMCDYIDIQTTLKTWGNVITLEQKTDVTSVNLTLIHPTFLKMHIDILSNVDSIIKLPPPSVAVSTHYHPAMPQICIQSKEVEIRSACNISTGECTTGLAAVSFEAETLDQQATCMLPYDQLIFI